MSGPAPPGDAKVPTKEERLAALRDELVTEFGDKRGQELFRQVQDFTLRRIGPEAWISALDPKDVSDIFSTIWAKGLAGLGSADLLKVDDLLSRSVARRRVMLRFLKYYLQEEDYAAVDTAFQLIGIIRDRSEHSANRSRLIRALYDRLRRLRYGDRIRNQISMGWLEKTTYPEMRRLEAKLAPAGRAHGNEAEAISQVFYRSLDPQPTRMWIRTAD